MIYLLSWTGRGWIALALIFGAVFIGFGFGALFQRGEVLFFGLAWVGAGTILTPLGVRWNRSGVIHRFCGMSITKWGVAYGVIGAFLAYFGAVGLQYGM